MEFCKKCLEDKCVSHKWFTDLKLKDEKEILIAELRHISEFDVISRVVEKVYLVESHLDLTGSMHIIDYIQGSLDFGINMPASAKMGEYYVPLESYGGRDDIIGHNISISVGIIRHNPMSIKVEKGIFDDTVMHDIRLIYSNDCLHMESIDDYRKIVNLANSRLNRYIEKLQNDTSLYA